MPETTLPIPAPIWRQLLAFLSAGKTGAITLNVHRGAVKEAEIKERIRGDEEAATR